LQALHSTYYMKGSMQCILESITRTFNLLVLLIILFIITCLNQIYKDLE
jgi:hypothetical protein